MTVTLRLVLDQLVAPTSRDLAEASASLAQALVDTAPRGCDVAAITPAPGLPDDAGITGLSAETRLSMRRRELAASWQLGVVPGIGRGLIHSPTALAPLVRHDRVNETHQIVVTLWDLRAWETPDELPRAEVLATRALLSRIGKHADAVVVPSHAMAERLAEVAKAKLVAKVRVIGGAPVAGFRVPSDVVGRLRALDLPSSFVALSGGAAASDGLAAAFTGLASEWDGDVVVLDVPEGEEPAVVELASAAGIPEARVHARGALDQWDRAAVLSHAVAFLVASTRTDWPWRAVDALALSVPIVARDTPVHREVLADAAAFAAEGELGAAVARALGPDAERLRVLAGDRAKGFAWAASAERVWALHAEL
ncbi:MAG: glycosyl transferase [Microbacterium sp. 71-36]|uniref:glycosyl transferase n=1 Tax=unclassified Microbacterium TaxID=2609290 RepID=UPI00086F4D42|nr:MULTISPECIES: glycosyl transferase [unclassified Microbacterium]MBN9210096.1 glycosyl transferase [Microbacterium sp.]ODT39784.1 MAG: glycosyl transferase [Microbacterium sp. SCN 71-17]ODU52281.1 MAG: glycosyl transferase [Microbacterium sp. SCN 70-10]OJV76098.1 MAG: glycosyl transferase [Microbacterium sp. 71-36]